MKITMQPDLEIEAVSLRKDAAADQGGAGIRPQDRLGVGPVHGIVPIPRVLVGRVLGGLY